MDVLAFYKEQLRFHEKEVNWYTDQIKRCGRIIKSETFDFGLSLDGECAKKREIGFIKQELNIRKNV